MNKALLTVVAAASFGSYAMAATPVDMQVFVSSASENNTVETLDAFTLKFMNGDNPVLGSQDIFVVDTDKRVAVKGSNGTVYATPLWFVPRSAVSCRLDNVITIPGTYVITVPEGLVTYTENGKEYTNKECSTTINIEGSKVTMTQLEWMQYFVIDPRDGASLTSLGSFTLAGNTKLTYKGGMDAELKAPDGKVYYSAPDLLNDYTQAQYRFSAPSDVKGNYTLTIPEGTLSTTLTGVGDVLNPKLVFNYVIRDAQVSVIPVEVDIESSPLNSTLEAASFSKYYLKITDGGEELGPFSIDPALISKVVIGSEYTSFAPATIANVEGDPSAIEITFSNPITFGGDYSITLPEGLLSWDRYTNAELTLENAFKCTGDVMKYFTGIEWTSGSTWSYRQPIPADGVVSSVGTINAAFPNIPAGQTLTIPMSGDDEYAVGTSKAYVTLPSGEVLERTISKAGMDGNAFKINVYMLGTSGYQEEGTYTIVVPAGSLYVGGLANPELRLELKVLDRNTYTPTDFGFTPNPRTEFPLEKLSYVSWSFSLFNGDTELYEVIGVKPGVKATVTPQGGASLEFPIVDYTFVTTTEAAFATDIDPDITANGTYVITVPEGAYRVRRKSDGALLCNPAFTTTYTVQNSTQPQIAPSISPAPGNVASLTRFEFLRPDGGYSIYVPDVVPNYTLTCPDGSKVNVQPTSNPNVEGDYIFVYLPETYNTPGKYTLSIPANGIEIFDAAGNFVQFPATNYEYTVVDYQVADLAYTVNPADNSKLYDLSYVYVTFDEKVTSAVGVQATVTNPAGETQKVTTSFNVANNRLLLDFGYNSAKGNYTFVIPEGTVFTADGRKNKEISIHYEYVDRVVEKINFVVTPHQGLVAQFSTVTVGAPEGFTFMEPFNYGITRVFFTIEGYDEEVGCNFKETSNDLVYRLELPEPVTVNEAMPRRDITLEIPESTFVLKKADGTQMVNASTRLTWRLDPAGVDEVFGDAASYTVFTLDGRCLYKAASRDVLDTLEEGMYIINGKTVMLVK